MAIRSCSEIKILSNFKGEIPANLTDLVKKELLFQRQTISNSGEKHIGYVKIENDKVADGSSSKIALPCPPYCDGKEENLSSILKFNLRVIGYFDFKFATNEAPDRAGYDANDIDFVLAQSEAKGIMEIDIKIIGESEIKKAIIGLDVKGRVMDGFDEIVAIKS